MTSPAEQRVAEGGAAGVETDERALEIKRAAQRQWSHDPAGAIAVGDDELGTSESFARVERHRYRQEQPWMHATFGFERFAGREVLEIGVGLGTDHLQFARAGARMTGIDLTPRCVELTARRFEQEGLQSSLHVMDAEQLAFPDDSFDAVYSFGVLHHTASAERAFAEVRRVLRPGGVFIGALYNRHSLFVGRMLARYYRSGAWRRERFGPWMSCIEISTAAEAPKPYVRLFSARELSSALKHAGFEHVKIVRRHSAFGRYRKFVPGPLDELAARTGGWYLVHEAS